jgi:mannose-6-phosphate isomerase
VGATDRFTILMGLEGEVEIRHRGQGTRLAFGQTLLLPASVGNCELIPAGAATVLTCVVP